jgi:DNA-binding HxlR family transcriptional regulator
MPPQAQADGGTLSCCPHYHAAVELLGRRWTGAIVEILLQAGDDRPLRFGEIAAAIPELSDRLLSQRLKDLEATGVVEKHTCPNRAGNARYALTPMGRSLQPAVAELKAWGRRWLDTADSEFRPA